ncbi:MAG: hypothetical protein IJN54_07890 [Lachnospiraceae bacterium]|nr:hypothetical protein [Lachnospiraceae bacterium]
MSKVIETYYRKTKLPEPLIVKKLEVLERNQDIKAEFEAWIESKVFMEYGCVEVAGYSAKSIAEMSRFVNGEGAFMLLIELRENREMALKRIADGFKMK